MNLGAKDPEKDEGQVGVKVYVCHPKREPVGSYIQVVVDGKKKHVITVTRRERANHKEIIEHLAKEIRQGKVCAQSIQKAEVFKVWPAAEL